jgi:hypothetical protein
MHKVLPDKKFSHELESGSGKYLGIYADNKDD